MHLRHKYLNANSFWRCFAKPYHIHMVMPCHRDDGFQTIHLMLQVQKHKLVEVLEPFMVVTLTA